MTGIASFMSEGVVSAEPEEDVASVARRMSEKDVGAVFLLAGAKVVGVFTERDLLTRVVAKGHDPAQTPVGEVATCDVVGVAEDASLRECAEKLERHGFRHLPVLGAGGAIGVLSARDFFQAAAAQMQGMLERRVYDSELSEGFDPYDHLGGSYGR
ncbi:MAG: CBS domain-containing protein [Deltaproteobacteria bacterium]|nr:CBS domain-containing protein [Deltaproteobacteria bacterium]